jgi:hypothetical protein
MNRSEKEELKEYVDLLMIQDDRNIVRNNVNRLYRDVYRNLSGDDSISTRSRLQVATTGCRFWQLFYAMLWYCILENKKILSLLTMKYNLNEHDMYDRLLQQLQRAVRVLYQDRSSSFHKLIFGNKGSLCTEDSVVCIRPYEPRLLSKEGNHYLCIYIERPDNSITLSHYFTIIHLDNAYYLTSSYGSDYVRAPYRVQAIQIEELNQLHASLEDHTLQENKEQIVEFYMKYFLQGNLPPFYSEEDVEGNPKLKGKRVLNGVYQEIKVVFNGKENGAIHIGVVDPYSSEIAGIMEASQRNRLRGGKSRSRKKNKKRVRFTVKRNRRS